MLSFLTMGVVAVPNAMADVYTFTATNVSGCPTNCGTVTVVQTSDPTQDTVQIAVAQNPSSMVFLETGGPHTPFAFNISGTPNVTIGNLTSGWIVPATLPGTFGTTPFGSFSYGLDCCGLQNGSSHAMSGLSFTVNYTSCAGGTNCLAPTSFATPNSLGYYFAADVTGITGSSTGSIAATLTSTVPEPTSIAFLGTGLIGLGFVLRRKFSGHR